MRRPKFSRWIRQEILEITKTKRFNLRLLASRAQTELEKERTRPAKPDGASKGESPSSPSLLAAALYLYAYENECLDRLAGLMYDKQVLAEYEKVGKHLGGRSVERLALRGTPMMSLPPQYRELMARFEEAYYTPERVADEKRELSERTREVVLRLGVSPTELSRALEIERANLSAFISHGETHRLNLQDARKLAEFVDQLDQLAHAATAEQLDQVSQAVMSSQAAQAAQAQADQATQDDRSAQSAA